MGLPAFSSAHPGGGGSTGSVTYVYTLPNIVTGSGIGNNYDLTVQKQAGIVRYAFNVSVQLPPRATMIHAENVGSNQMEPRRRSRERRVHLEGLMNGTENVLHSSFSLLSLRL